MEEKKPTNSEKWENIQKRYFSYIKYERNLSDNSVEAYMRDVSKFSNYIIRMCDVAPADVEPVMIERFMQWLYNKEAANNDAEVQLYEKSSQARILSSIRSFYNFLLILGAVETLPTEFVAAPKPSQHLPDTLSVEEIDLIISTIDTSTKKGIRDRAMLETLYSCGLRVSELTALRLGDLFFGQALAAVFDADIDKVVVLGVVKLNIATLIDKLDGIVGQIVDHLMDQVLIRFDHDPIVIQPTDIEMLILDRLLKAEHRATAEINDIELLGVDLRLSVLDAG